LVSPLQYVSSNIFNKISKAPTLNEGWDTPIKTYNDGDKNKKVKLQTLIQQFEFLSIEENETIFEYFDRVRELANAMRACKDSITTNMLWICSQELAFQSRTNYKRRNKVQEKDKKTVVKKMKFHDHKKSN